MTRDVLITGIGGICAIGRSPVEIFASAMTGRSGVRAAPHLAFGAAVPLVARAPFDAATVAMRTRGAPLDRVSALALEAARQALADAGASPAESPDARLGVYWGTGAGGVESLEEGYRLIFGQDNFRVRPTTVVTVMSNAPAACVSIDVQAGGPCLTYSVACASSTIAIGEAMLAIRSGRVDRAIAGGSEAMLTRPVLAAWSALRALASADAVDPSMSCKPFAADRCGFVLGEGAAALLLESAEHAAARGARGYAGLAGYGVASDAAHLADPSSEGQSRAIALALDDAALDPRDVGYINAHGTATLAGDRSETRSIKRVFGEHARSAAVSSTKAVHGHTMGAAGALEFVIALMALHHRAVPPTAHLRRPDPELDLDFVAQGARHDVDLQAVMSNSFAFGGTNAVLAARRCPPALSRA